jgi:hypothetical protein
VPGYLNKFSFLVFLVSVVASAHIPKAGQVARFQSNVLKGLNSFQVKGSVSAAGSVIASQLKWYGPGSYEFILNDVPKKFSSLDNSMSNAWILTRSRGGACTLKIYGMIVQCPVATFWGALELSGQPDLAAKALVESEFYTASDAAWSETDSRTLLSDNKESRLKLVVGTMNKIPLALLQAIGPDARGDDDAKYPLIEFDQTFLCPIFARLKSREGLMTLAASSDLEVRRNRSRFTHVLASKINITENGKALAEFKRGEAIEDTKLVAPKQVGAASKLDALGHVLNDEGERLVRAMLLTH